MRRDHPLRLGLLVALGGLLPMSGLAFLGYATFWLMKKVFESDGDGQGALLGLSLVLGLFVLGCLRRLFKLFQSPQGLAIPDDELTQIHQAVEEVRQGFQTDRVRRITLVRGFPLDLFTLPVLGPLGWASHHLVLGVFPLMYLTPREFKCAVGWDFAYWSRQHGWLNLEVKRLIEFWDRLLQTLPSPPTKVSFRGSSSSVFSSSDAVLKGFSRWFLDRARPFYHSEIGKADLSVAQAFGPATAAQWLGKRAMAQPLVDQIMWPQWIQKDEAGEGWPEAPFLACQAFLKQWQGERGDQLFSSLMAHDIPAPLGFAVRMNSWVDTPMAPLPPSTSMWELCTEYASPTLDQLESKWRMELKGMTQRREEAVRARKDRYAELIRVASNRDLTSQEQLELCKWAEHEEAPELFRNRLDALVEALPRSGDAWLQRTRYLLEQGEVTLGLEALSTLRSLHPLNEGHCETLWAQHLERTGDAEGAALAFKKALEAESRVAEAREERASFRTHDPMTTHGLDADGLSHIQAFLAREKDVRKAFLVRKRLRHYPDRPVYMLGLMVRHPWWGKEKRRKALQTRIANTCPPPMDGKLFVLVFGDRASQVSSPLRRLPGTLIFRRPHPLARLFGQRPIP